MEKEIFIEIMTHIATIEKIITVKYDISEEELDECLKKNKEYIREQLK